MKSTKREPHFVHIERRRSGSFKKMFETNRGALTPFVKYSPVLCIGIGSLIISVFSGSWLYLMIIGSRNKWKSWLMWSGITLPEEITLMVDIWVLTILLLIIIPVVFYASSVIASRMVDTLHDYLVHSILHAPISTLTDNLLGSLMFSLDSGMRYLDSQFPFSVSRLLQYWAMLMTNIGLIFMGFPLAIVPTLGFLIFTYYICSYCLPTTSKLKNLEIQLQKTVRDHFNFSEGQIICMRSLKMTEMYRKLYSDQQDLHSWALFLVWSLTEGVSLWLCLASVLNTTFITCLFLPTNYSDGPVLALTTYSSLMVTNLIPHIVQDAALVSRLIEFIKQMFTCLDIPQEPLTSSVKHHDEYLGSRASVETFHLYGTWPSTGNIEVTNLMVPTSTKSMNFKINSGETVSVTGSSKLLLLGILYRLIEWKVGSVWIDGVDTQRVSLHTMRASLSFIPGNPVLFSGLLRNTLDPNRRVSDEKLWAALDQVGMKEAISELSFGLLTESNQFNTIFNYQQRQLIFLAVAIASNRPITVLDLNSKYLHSEDELEFLRKAKQLLSGKTIIVLSDRLRCVLSADRVMVIENDTIKEFDRPFTLVKDPNSHIHRLIMGINSADIREELFENARQAFYEVTRRKKSSSTDNT